MKTLQIAQFKVNSGLPGYLFKKVEELSREYDWQAMYSMAVRDIEVGEWVQLKCRYGCPNYNSNWCCPPASPDTERVRSILQEYSLALLLVGQERNPEYYNNSRRKRIKQVRCWKETVALERYLFLQGYYKAFSLLPGPCSLCRECAYPQTCHFPQERRPSLESFSIDVIASVKNLGLSTPVASTVKDFYYRYAIILVE